MADDIEHAARHCVASSAIAYARYLTHAGQCGNGTHPHMPPIARQVGLDTGRSGRSGHARHGPHQLRDAWTASPSCSAAATVSGSSAHDQHPGPAGHLSQGQGSHRAANLIAGYGLTSAAGPAGVSACCCLRPSLGLSSPRRGAGSVPWYFPWRPANQLRCPAWQADVLPGCPPEEQSDDAAG